MRPLTDNTPLYHKLAGLLEGMIQARSLRPGDKMPSVRQFSRQQRVSVPTALHAYVTLENRGLLEARPKSGFYVRSRIADGVRPPSNAVRPKVTNLSTLDPMDAVLAQHSHPDLLPLGAALPNPELLPGVKLAREMAVIARRLGAKGTNYDMAPGSEILRREIARRSLEWGCTLKPDDFIITNGCTEAVSLALRAICKPGDTVAVESPTYFGLARTLREQGLKALPIRVDSEKGIDLEMLASALQKTRVAACALIPNFHNPVGFSMTDERKQALLEIVNKHEIPIIEDDIYADLQFAGPRPRCIKAFDREDAVLLCSSFSKTLAPGYRVGYIAAGRWHSKVMRLKQCTSLANATLPSLVIADYLKNGGYDRFLRSIRNTYRDQTARMREAVVDSFPAGIGLSHPSGGYVLWIELPVKVDSLELFERSRQAGVSIAPGPMFSPDGGFRNFIRLNCGNPFTPEIERGVATIGRLVRQMC